MVDIVRSMQEAKKHRGRKIPRSFALLSFFRLRLRQCGRARVATDPDAAAYYSGAAMAWYSKRLANHSKRRSNEIARLSEA